jgi:adenosylcobyric acid synthase
MTAKSVMVLGTTSGAGKSWLTTALCRYYARQGLKVAPFKAQNMSNNARVIAPTLVASRTALPPKGASFSWGGPAKNCSGEIGSAQYFQALAARAVPDVRMNPLLLKTEKDRHSQVMLMGRINAELSPVYPPIQGPASAAQSRP